MSVSISIESCSMAETCKDRGTRDDNGSEPSASSARFCRQIYFADNFGAPWDTREHHGSLQYICLTLEQLGFSIVFQEGLTYLVSIGPCQIQQNSNSSLKRT